jgi:3-dehydroquinate synthase
VNSNLAYFSKQDELNDHLISFSERKIFVIADENTFLKCFVKLPSLKNVPILVLAPGEEIKSLISCELIWDFLQENNADRKSLLINIGGGVITDLGGFAASLYQRGIDFIHIPTSLLAMVDAAIGSKTGIDFKHLKNYIGNFTPAKNILICPDFLTTLPREEWTNGWSEAIKHALIADRELLNKIYEQIILAPQSISLELLQRSCKIKIDLVEIDPYEEGKRKALNFGHTIGHALESFFLKIGKPIPHGLAIAAGMMMESDISQLKNNGFTDFQKVQDVLNFFPRIEYKIEDCGEIAQLTLKDKKNQNGVINFTTLNAIGQFKIDTSVEIPLIEQVLVNYCKNE